MEDNVFKIAPLRLLGILPCRDGPKNSNILTANKVRMDKCGYIDLTD